MIYIHEHSNYSFIPTDPVPPGPIDRNASIFHPQTLFLKWAEHNYYVDKYRIGINQSYHLSSSSTEFSLSRHLEPGKNYAIRIVAYCWYNRFYTKTAAYDGHIKTERKWNIFCTQHNTVFSLMSFVKYYFK